MTSAELLVDSFARIREVVHQVLAGLTREQLAARVDSEANSIGWLIWHLTRIQDDHVAGVAGTEQVWMSEGWSIDSSCRSSPRTTGTGTARSR
jgi:hypothetical protein